jgi:Na+-transporting NADH:ubiquinone oxidoreductase subunit D
VANCLGYASVLAIIGLFRELLGTGKVLGYPVLKGTWYTPNQLMILAPGAFFALGIVIAIFNVYRKPETEEKKK